MEKKELLVRKSKIKKEINDMNMAQDVPDCLSKKVESILKEAVERAKANGRRTVQAKDI